MTVHHLINYFIFYFSITVEIQYYFILATPSSRPEVPPIPSFNLASKTVKFQVTKEI